MHVRMRLASREHTTEHDLWIVRSEDRVEVEVDGETYEATVRREEGGTMIVDLDGEVLRVQLTGDQAARIQGHHVGFQLSGFKPGGAPGEHGGPSAQAPGAVLPPMPGKVATLHVATGDVVEEGDPVAVLEAMKMQSTIHAPRSGTVRSVHVTQGQAVDGTDVLLEIGDEDEAA